MLAGARGSNPPTSYHPASSSGERLFPVLCFVSMTSQSPRCSNRPPPIRDLNVIGTTTQAKSHVHEAGVARPVGPVSRPCVVYSPLST